jgi:hypothetical protein
MTDRPVKERLEAGAVTDDGSSAFYARVDYRRAMLRCVGELPLEAD